jgi:uncharacterized protein (TIGR03437 family)
VRIYVAGNAGNGNDADTGDRIFTTSVTLTPNVTSGPKPAIQSSNGVTNGATFEPGIVSGSWTTIYGEHLALTTRSWLETDFNSGQAPTSLDGVRVNIDGKPAAVSYISPGQINLQAPTLDKLGPVAVEVMTPNGSSQIVNAEVRRAAPGWFMFPQENRKYIAGTTANGALLGKAGLLGTSSTTQAAKPGDTIILYGANFGPTRPPLPPGREVTELSPLEDPPTATIGGMNAIVRYGGGAPNLIGTYQFNLVVPDVPNGDHEVVVTTGGVRTQANAFITVQR